MASGGRHVLSAAGAPQGRLAGFPAGTLSVVSLVAIPGLYAAVDLATRRRFRGR